MATVALAEDLAIDHHHVAAADGVDLELGGRVLGENLLLRSHAVFLWMVYPILPWLRINVNPSDRGPCRTSGPSHSPGNHSPWPRDHPADRPPQQCSEWHPAQ